MIKTRINNEYEDIIKIFGGGILQKEITKVWSREANKYVYESEVEYTGPLPITITVDGSALLDYKIYGNTEQDGTPTPEAPVDVVGCGVRVDITGLSEPLCGIGTYTDSLDLSTGTLTRRIKKLVLTGEEYWTTYKSTFFYMSVASSGLMGPQYIISSHFVGALITTNSTNVGVQILQAQLRIRPKSVASTTIDGFKSYLAAQYAAGTPVTVWYVLEEPEVSTITVPSGLTGTIEGYLIQDGTPTPETPIYPIANGIKQSDGTYSIEYGYKLPILSNSTVTNIYLGEVESERKIGKIDLSEVSWVKLADGLWRTLDIPNIKYSSVNTELGGGIAEKYTIHTGAGMISALNCIAIDVSQVSVNTGSNTETPTGMFWYVLDTPTTGIFNEPLMKIGDYADTISMEQADASIPTFAGTTVIDYDGTPKPSQMYIKYRR